MTATEVRADALVRLAEYKREGTLPGADENLFLQAIFPNIAPTVYVVHWVKVCRYIEEEHAYRNGKWDDTEPLWRMDAHSRSVAAEQMADEARAEARDNALCCVMVATRHAASKYVGVA